MYSLVGGNFPLCLKRSCFGVQNLFLDKIFPQKRYAITQ